WRGQWRGGEASLGSLRSKKTSRVVIERAPVVDPVRYAFRLIELYKFAKRSFMGMMKKYSTSAHSHASSCAD
ncbi:hypothetical protein HID58_018063, partial [Brassica napus]